MENIKACDLSIDLRDPVRTRDNCLLYKTTDNKIVKIFSKEVLDRWGKEVKHILSDPRDIEGVVKPSNFVLLGNEDLAGYSMDNISGENDIVYEERLDDQTRNNLYRVAQKYKELEDIVKNAGNDVIFPCLLDRESIIHDEKGKIKLINYDNLQVGSYTPISVNPKVLKKDGWAGELSKYYNPIGCLYDDDGPVYTKELDKKSLICYFLDSVLGINTTVALDPHSYHYWILKEALGGNDCDEILLEKIISVNSSKYSNPYISEDIQRIAENYTLVDNNYRTDYYAKRLIKK